ncbi:MAG: SsrA-binding protein SmpB [Kiritimatiellae bacterium]|nr:SsrA-binding protein SmpB [Kiritimatiellia bacterium]
MPSGQQSGNGGQRKHLAQNRKALHDYEVLERIEAGIALCGTEVKVVRAGHASIVNAWAQIDKNTGEAWLCEVNIPPYGFGNIFNHEASRRRKLLLHRKEILRLRAWEERKGCTLIPLSLYLARGRVKCELAVCRGKDAADKREAMKRRESAIDARRAIADHARGKR